MVDTNKASASKTKAALPLLVSLCFTILALLALYLGGFFQKACDMFQECKGQLGDTETAFVPVPEGTVTSPTIVVDGKELPVVQVPVTPTAVQ